MVSDSSGAAPPNARAGRTRPVDAASLRASLETMAESFERLQNLLDFGTVIAFGATCICLAGVLIAAGAGIDLHAWDYAPVGLAPILVAYASHLAFLAAQCDRTTLRFLRPDRGESADGRR